MFTTDRLVQTSCIWEAVARKVGNVHRSADFAGTSLTDFLISAAAAAPFFNDRSTRNVGETIELAAGATRAAVGQNTNLGILLLLGPLAAVAREIPLRDGLDTVFHRLNADDARRVYAAIRSANPGGLGEAPEQDVRDEPTVTLLDAMRLAAGRDFVARQYANGYADVLDFGVPRFLAAFEKFGRIEPAVIECQLHWLAEFPDSLIARKCGPGVAEDVRKRVGDVLSRGGLDTPSGRRAGVGFDRFLRSDGNRLNPGTTADLVTACLFVALREDKVKPSDPFPWDAPDWL